MDRRSPSDLVAAENLTNCYVREGGDWSLLNENQLRIPLQASKNLNCSLIVTFESQFVLGDVRLSAPARLRFFDSEVDDRELAASEVIELLAAEVHANHLHDESRKPDWYENFENSCLVGEMILKESVARKPESEIDDFVSSEQSLTIGHRFHPSPKSRIGFEGNDIRNFSPEFKTSFPLHYFAISKDLVFLIGHADEADRWQEFASSFTSPEKSRVVVPVHPWQAKRAMQSTAFRNAVEAGGLMDLGSIGPLFYPLASVRTLYQPEADIFLKTSLDVRITNCFRPNLRPEMLSSFALTKLLDDCGLDLPDFKIAREPLSIDTRLSEEIHLGTIFREGLAKTLGRKKRPEESLLLAASLFGDREHSVRRLQRLIGSHRDDVVPWFESYCALLIPPVLSYFDFGLMFEPHLQNITVVLENAKPSKIILRDLDNAKVIAESGLDFRAQQMKVPRSAFFDEEHAWKRLNYCLFVNHLSEAVSALSLLLDYKEAESELWLVIRKSLENPLVPPRLRQILASDPYLYAKRNFLTRLVRGDDLTAPFAKLKSPICDRFRSAQR